MTNTYKWMEQYNLNRNAYAFGFPNFATMNRNCRLYFVIHQSLGCVVFCICTLSIWVKCHIYFVPHLSFRREQPSQVCFTNVT